MKYLFVTQYFFPEEFRGNDIAFDWAAKGDQVTVITAIPNYPSGKFTEGYGLFTKRKEIINGVEVIRIPVIPRGKDNNIQLMLNYLSFALIGSLYALIIGISRKFDAIFVQQLSPITLALPGIIVKKIQKIPLTLWVLDLWPESLTSGGNIKNKQILSFFEYIVKFTYKNSDKILISSKGFENSILRKGDFKTKIMHFPNWAEDVFTNKDVKTIDKLPTGFKVMFAGNIGESQDFENIMQAALLLKENKNIKFIILGDGRKKSWVDDFCSKNNLTDTVLCLGRFPIETMPSFFEKADVMLVTLKNDPILNITLPAKVQAYMACAKPIIGMLNGDGAETIENANCGYSVNASDYTKLSEAILMMSQKDTSELNKFGLNGLKFAKENYDKSHLMNKLYSEIMNNNQDIS